MNIRNVKIIMKRRNSRWSRGIEKQKNQITTHETKDKQNQDGTDEKTKVFATTSRAASWLALGKKGS